MRFEAAREDREVVVHCSDIHLCSPGQRAKKSSDSSEALLVENKGERTVCYSAVQREDKIEADAAEQSRGHQAAGTGFSLEQLVSARPVSLIWAACWTKTNGRSWLG